MIKSEIDSSIFKDVIGRWRTQSLFLETEVDPATRAKYPPIFLLKEDKDRDGLTSMKRIYMEQGDPTEYRAALAIFGCWDAWENLVTKAPFFQPYLEKWRAELALRLRSEATNAIIDVGVRHKTMSGTQYQAAKWVAELGWNNQSSSGGNKGGGDPQSAPVGRPSKAAIHREAERMMRAELIASGTATEDAKRLGLEI